MNFTALLLLALMGGTVHSLPVHECPNDCTQTNHHHKQHFRHVSDLETSSVAPWSLRVNITEGREPAAIRHAVCNSCTVENMVARPIFYEVSVYNRLHDNTWCRCPYQVAVGCTCVRE